MRNERLARNTRRSGAAEPGRQRAHNQRRSAL